MVGKNGRMSMGTKKFKMEMEIILQNLIVSQVVIEITMVVSPILEVPLSSGVLMRLTPSSPGIVAYAASMVLCADTTTLSQLVVPSVSTGLTN
jgi:hypothetical protein